MFAELEDLKVKIEEISAPFLEDMGLELFDTEIKRSGKTMSIQMLIDKPRGGISLDECTFINKKIIGVIEQKELLDDYTLEVSSPGLDRPLVKAKDFQRVMGRRVRFHLKEKLENKLEYAGRIEDADKNQVTIRINDHTLVIPIEKIHKAVQVI